MKLTTNYNLIKPELTDSPPDITAMNPNWDAIDTELKSHDDKLKNLSAYAVANGTNTYTAAISGITALTEGMTVKVKFANANSGASTLNINSLGAKAIVKSNGNALSSGNIKAGQICNLAYNGSNFQLLGEGGEYGTATAPDVLSGKTIGTEEGLVSGTIPNRGSVNQNLTTEGQEYTIPEGYHNGLGKIKAVIIGLVASVIKAGATVGGIAGSFTNDATATAAQMLSGVIAYVKGNKITGTIPSKGAQTYTPGTTNQTIAAGQYLSGIQTILGSSNLIEGNIKKGVNIFGKVGTVKEAEARFFGEVRNTGYGSFGIDSSNDYVNIGRDAVFNHVLCILSDSNVSNSKTFTANDYFSYCFSRSTSSTDLQKGRTTSYTKVFNSNHQIVIYNPKKLNITMTTVSGIMRKYILID